MKKLLTEEERGVARATRVLDLKCLSPKRLQIAQKMLFVIYEKMRKSLGNLTNLVWR